MPSVRIPGGGRVRVGKIVCVGQNYAGHARETAADLSRRGPGMESGSMRAVRDKGSRGPGGTVGSPRAQGSTACPRPSGLAARVREMGVSPGGEPIFFLKPATAIIHDGGTIRIPDGVGEVHHEVELAVVLGSKAKTVGAKDALENVLGYAVAIDVTARDVQRKAKLEGRPWTVSKGYDTFFPLGECVPADRVPDPSKLVLRLSVNGTVRQEAPTSGMIHTVPDLISRVSALMTLDRGDVISTGTPEGVGPLVPGDVVVAELVGLSRLNLKVRARRPN